LAHEIAGAGPLGVMETRATLRMGLSDKVKAATDREKMMQDRLRETEDFQEGIAASSERRKPDFKGM
jgi:enoyl-CoA hydratase/carnithine racemase